MKMKKLLSRFDLSHLPRGYWNLFSLHIGYQIFTALPAVFINTFFMRLEGTQNAALHYNLIIFAVLGAAMLVSCAVLRRFSAGFCVRVGIILYNLMYLTLILTRENAAAFMPLIAVLHGLAMAFYWISYTALLTENTTARTRAPAQSMLWVFGAGINFVCPIISTAILSLSGTGNDSEPRLTGYMILFSLALAVSVVTAVFSFRLKTKPGQSRTVAYRAAAREMFTRSEWYIANMSALFNGIRDGIFQFLISLLVFQLVMNEFWVGVDSFAAGIAAIISAVLATRFLRQRNYIRSIVLSNFVVLLAVSLIIIKMNIVTLIIVTAIVELTGAFSFSPSSLIYYELMEADPKTKNIVPEVLAFREIFLNLGRCAGIALYLAVPKDRAFIAAVMIGIILLQFGTAALGSMTAKNAKRIQEE